MIKPDTVTLFVLGVVAGVDVGLGEEIEDGSVVKALKLITQLTATIAIAKIIIMAKAFRALFISDL
jgi:hypothetical protein